MNRFHNLKIIQHNFSMQNCIASIFHMEDIDTLCTNSIRLLSMDMINKAKSGHPGAPLGLSPAAHVLWSKFLRFEPNWINRDRFVLSCGHASALYYSLLHIYSNILTITDLKQFRQYKSKTPGHPEHSVIPEIEVTTGPLGQGITNSVGLSIAAHYMAAKFNKPDIQLFDHRVFCFASDGDMMEGISSEAASFAGHHRLNNLIVLYDCNHITIDGKTDITFTENVSTRFKSYGWHTTTVKDANNDFNEIEDALNEALEIKDKPVLIILHTTIGYGSDMADTSKVHGSPLNDEQLAEIKKKFGFDPEAKFKVPQEVYDYYKEAHDKNVQRVNEWNEKFVEYQNKYKEDYEVLNKIIEGKFNYEDFDKFMPKKDESGAATRVTSGIALNIVANNVPGLIGGSADLSASNGTTLKRERIFQPNQRDGRYIEFGIREHSMQAISNGIAYYGLKGLVPFTATFLVFYQYLLPAIRVAALEKLRVLMIFSHDSIGVGEDGPTHQPVECLAQLRSQIGINVFRPACQLEVNACYTQALCGPSKPSAIVVSRQNAPPIPGSSYEGTLKGAYVVKKVENPKLVFVATGTEVLLALRASELLSFPVQVVSMPCINLYDEQPIEYKRSLFPADVPVVSIEASIPYTWAQYSHLHIGVNSYGLSAPANKVYEHFGLVPDKIAEKANQVLEFYKSHPVPDLIERP